MKITRQEDIALLFLSELSSAYGQRVVPLSEITAKHGVSVLFLKKIARVLRSSGLVTSKEGAHGGYSLTRSPRDITLLEILSPFSGSEFTNTASYSSCPLVATCLPQHISRKLTVAIAESFSHIRLTELGGSV